MTKLERV